MWACRFCGREFEQLYDACHNCPCRADPDTVKLRRHRSWSLLGRLALGMMVGFLLGALTFGLPQADDVGSLFGAGMVGLVIGIIWALTRWIAAPPGPGPSVWPQFLRIALGVAMGVGQGALQFYLFRLPVDEGLRRGAFIGLVVGVIWGYCVRQKPQSSRAEVDSKPADPGVPKDAARVVSHQEAPNQRV